MNSTYLEQATLQASTPDQILGYVQAVSAVHSAIENDYLIHYQQNHAIVIGYTLGHDILNSTNIADLEKLLETLQKKSHIERITVLAPQKPICAPPHAQCHSDVYYFLPLPLAHEKAHAPLSMVRRAMPHIYIAHQDETWTSAHQELMLRYLQRPDVSKEMGHIFQRIEHYCRTAPHVRIFSAYDTQSNELLGTCIGDFSSLQTAFYMFAFRHAHATPGVSEALLLALLQEAEKSGYAWCNLGLGINRGIGFFKEKWGALPILPLVECTWEIGAQSAHKETLQPSPKYKGHKEHKEYAKQSWWTRLASLGRRKTL